MPYPKRFQRLSNFVSRTAGNPIAFFAAVSVILAWAITGPIFGFSDTWQLVINTGTTIVTFLMVFLIQNTQNRDTSAVQIKLDELIRATAKAHNAILDVEELSEEDLYRLRQAYEKLAAKARHRLEIRKFEVNYRPHHRKTHRKSAI